MGVPSPYIDASWVQSHLGQDDKGVHWLDNGFREHKRVTMRLLSSQPRAEIGGPSIPLLFLIVVNVLSRMCMKAARAGWIAGISCVEEGTPVTHLQYADDTMVFAAPEESVLEGYRFILTSFSMLSGLCINWSKSSIWAIRVEPRRAEGMAAIFGYNIQQAPSAHLGLPLVQRRLLRHDWSPLVERFIKKLGGWQNRSLSSSGKLTLLKSVLSSMPLFFLSIYWIPRTVLQRIEVIRRHFFWNGSNKDSNRPHLVAWESICQSKS
ncbi:hypothetical protein QJS04_geneDACA018756 [Acorus gramineus]|uniref:Reverse transcriptase domain-containing protein n=1 Tax=Acorus gramineus TaxID=55184 RepID=A0AAV9AEN5_ACOGR|nr:hypothetical protein QJS04_geneDACA018756 [Acorus gramineus]